MKRQNPYLCARPYSLSNQSLSRLSFRAIEDLDKWLSMLVGNPPAGGTEFGLLVQQKHENTSVQTEVFSLEKRPKFDILNDICYTLFVSIELQ